jgi:hypothetical protein
MFSTYLRNYLIDKNIDIDDAIIIFKRLNRITDGGFYLDNEINTEIVEQPLYIVEELEKKYSLLTTLNTMRFLGTLAKLYFPANNTLLEEYDDIINDCLAIVEAPNSYNKLTYTELLEFIEKKSLYFLTLSDNHTRYRNFFLLCFLLLECPLKLNELINIKYIGYEGADFYDTREYAVVVLKKHDHYYLIKNNGDISQQEILELKNNTFLKLLGKYISTYLKNYNCLFSIASGKPITKANISNGLINFTRKELGIAVGIQDCRRLFNSRFNLTSSSHSF